MCVGGLVVQLWLGGRGLVVRCLIVKLVISGFISSVYLFMSKVKKFDLLYCFIKSKVFMYCMELTRGAGHYDSGTYHPSGVLGQFMAWGYITTSISVENGPSNSTPQYYAYFSGGGGVLPHYLHTDNHRSSHPHYPCSTQPSLPTPTYHISHHTLHHSIGSVEHFSGFILMMHIKRYKENQTFIVMSGRSFSLNRFCVNCLKKLPHCFKKPLVHCSVQTSQYPSILWLTW